MEIIRRVPVVARVIALFLFVAVGVGLSQIPDSHPPGSQTPDTESTLPSGRQFSPPHYLANPDVPPDVAFGSLGIGIDPYVNDFAWTTFVALNWPASDIEKGVPNRQNLIGGSPRGAHGFYHQNEALPPGPTVWETFKDAKDIYLNPPVKPTPFNAPESIPEACRELALQNPSAARRTMTMITKASETLSDVRQAFTMSPLIDLNGELVRYEVKVNETYYNFIVDHGYYDSRKQPSGDVNFPEGANDRNGLGAIRVKAAWKVMSKPGAKFPDDPKRFFTTEALIYNEITKTCSKQLMGLVGLHIVQKTQNFPRYVWATFEHVDNAPTPDEIKNGEAAKKTWSFYDPASTAAWNVPPPPNDPAKWNVPVQVVRLVPVTGNAASGNSNFRPMLRALDPDGPTNPGNVWANYMLVGAQWMSPERTANPNQPKFLANVTMETYLQTEEPDENSPHGCINCHNAFALHTDGDFQMAQAWPQAPARARAIYLKSMALPGPR